MMGSLLLSQVSRVDPATPQEEAKRALLDKLATYIDEKIVFAGNMVVANAAAKVEGGDVILTYAHSAIVLAILLAAKQASDLVSSSAAAWQVIGL